MLPAMAETPQKPTDPEQSPEAMLPQEEVTNSFFPWIHRNSGKNFEVLNSF